MSLGGEMYFRTLTEYLAWFRGRVAVPVTAFGPAATAWEHDRGLLCRALGLPGTGTPGNPVRFTAAETGPVEGVVFSASANAIGVRTPDAFYRFLRGFGHPMVAAHQLFAPEANPGRAGQAWESWLARVVNPNERPC